MFSLSCGHKVKNLHDSYLVAVKDQTCDYYMGRWTPVVTHMEVCEECYNRYLVSNMLLLTREDEENYLVGNIQY